jgi:uncharacterized repeat protein (TIGR04052 family)
MPSRSSHLAVVVTLGLAACGDPEGTVSGESAELTFAVTVGGVPFECGETYGGVGLSQAELVPNEMKFFIHNVELFDESGAGVPFSVTDDSQWQHDGIVLLDFENGTEACRNGSASNNTRVVGTVESGRVVSGIRFTVGVPEAYNHENAAIAVAPLSTTTMWWAWLTGYKFIRIDARNGSGDPFLLHLGSTGCSGKVGVDLACTRPNRAVVELDGLELGTSVVELDLAELFAGLALDENDEGTEPGCMSDVGDSDCAPIFEALGLDLQTGLPAGDAYAFRIR